MDVKLDVEGQYTWSTLVMHDGTPIFVGRAVDGSLRASVLVEVPQAQTFAWSKPQVLTSAPLYRWQGDTKTEKLTPDMLASAPPQVVSDGSYIHVFQVATSFDLYLHRWIVDIRSGLFQRPFEVREISKDEFAYQDKDGNYFEEPAMRLATADAMHDTRFAVTLVPTSVPGLSRWQIVTLVRPTHLDVISLLRDEQGQFATKPRTINYAPLDEKGKPLDVVTLTIPVRKVVEIELEGPLSTGLAAGLYVRHEKGADGKTTKDDVHCMIAFGTADGSLGIVDCEIEKTGLLAKQPKKVMLTAPADKAAFVRIDEAAVGDTPVVLDSADGYVHVIFPDPAGAIISATYDSLNERWVDRSTPLAQPPIDIGQWASERTRYVTPGSEIMVVNGELAQNKDYRPDLFPFLNREGAPSMVLGTSTAVWRYEPLDEAPYEYGHGPLGACVAASYEDGWLLGYPGWSDPRVLSGVCELSRDRILFWTSNEQTVSFIIGACDRSVSGFEQGYARAWKEVARGMLDAEMLHLSEYGRDETHPLVEGVGGLADDRVVLWRVLGDRATFAIWEFAADIIPGQPPGRWIAGGPWTDALFEDASPNNWGPSQAFKALAFVRMDERVVVASGEGRCAVWEYDGSKTGTLPTFPGRRVAHGNVPRGWGEGGDNWRPGGIVWLGGDRFLSWTGQERSLEASIYRVEVRADGSLATTPLTSLRGGEVAFPRGFNGDQTVAAIVRLGPSTMKGPVAALELGIINPGPKVSGTMYRLYVGLGRGQRVMCRLIEVAKLEASYAGKSTVHPTLIGFLEGAPPVPIENLEANHDYRDATMKGRPAFYHSSVVYEVTDSSTDTWTTARNYGGDLRLEAERSGGVGVGLASGSVTVKASVDAAYGVVSESREASGITRTQRLSYDLVGDPQEDKWVPLNRGVAVLAGLNLDVYALRLAGRERVVSYQLAPSDSQSDDTKLTHIDFDMSPTYTKVGTLDGWIGNTPDPTFGSPTVGGEYSYYKPREEKRWRRRIDEQLQSRRAFFERFDPNAFAKLSKEQTARLYQRSMYSTYSWLPGTFVADEKHTTNVAESAHGGSFDFNARLTISTEASVGLKLGDLGAKVSQKLTASAGFNMKYTSRTARETASSFSIKSVVDLDPKTAKPGEHVRRYDFTTFYLEGENDHFNQFFAKVVDRAWLQGTSDEAEILRAAMNRPSKPWRIVHRVTFVDRDKQQGD